MPFWPIPKYSETDDLRQPPPVAAEPPTLDATEITEEVRRRLVSEASREPAPLTFREKEPLGGPRRNEPGVDCMSATQASVSE